MLGFVILYGLATGLKFLLRPYILIPLAGVVTALWFNPENSKHWHIIAALVVVGLLMALYEHLVQTYRERFLDKRMSVNYRNFPEESSARDLGLYFITYLPSLLLFVLLFYAATWALALPFASPVLASMITGVVCVWLYASNELVVRPSWSPNGPRPIAEKRFDIHNAAESGDLEQLREALDDGANPNQVTNKQMAPLHIACKAGQVEAARLLIEHGADVNRPGSDFKPMTPLMFAAETGDRSIVELLLQHGADPHVLAHEDRNVLYHALGRPEIFQFLVEQGVNYRNIDQYGDSLLTRSAGKQGESVTSHDPASASVVQQLLQLGIPADGLVEEEGVPIVEAAFTGNLDVIKILVEHGADLNRATRYGTTALFQAVEHGNTDLIRYLLQHGADPGLESKTVSMDEAITPLAMLQKREGSYYDDEQERRDKEIISLLQATR